MKNAFKYTEKNGLYSEGGLNFEWSFIARLVLIKSDLYSESGPNYEGSL